MRSYVPSARELYQGSTSRGRDSHYFYLTFTQLLADVDPNGQGASVRSDMTSTIPSSIDGEPTALRDEPKLIAKIGAQAQDASTTEGAQHFDNAAQKLDEAYKQDQEWLAKHPEHANTRI